MTDSLRNAFTFKTLSCFQRINVIIAENKYVFTWKNDARTTKQHNNVRKARVVIIQMGVD